ncbi:unnamed protein product, partial [marine sediment metagenome]
MIYIIIPVHNRIKLTINCLDSLQRQTYRNFTTIVVDDGSTDGTSNIIKEKFCGTLEESKFPDEFFNTVILSQVLEHLPSPRASLREIFRILKPGGKVFIYCPNASSYLRKLFGKYWHGWHIPFHFYAFTQQTIKKLAESAGFKIEDIFTVTPDNFFTVSVKSHLYSRNYAKRDYR